MEEHRELAEGLCQFMEGRTGPVIRDLEEQMRQASAELNFERAAKLRDDVKALRTVLERNGGRARRGSDGGTVFSLVSDAWTRPCTSSMCAAGASAARAAG